MERLFSRTLGFLILLVTSNLAAPSLVLDSLAGSKERVSELLSIGEPSPKAIKFKVWTNKEEGEPFHHGDRVIILLSAERQSYVTILAKSSDDSITVVLPNKLMRDNTVQPNKLYALFGDDAPVRLTIGEEASQGELLLYLSSTPIDLEPLVIPEGNGWLTIAGDAKNKIQTLKEKLQTIASGEEFNRTAILLPSETGKNLAVQLTEVPVHQGRKALPGGTESAIPETLTGSAGLKPLRKGKLKD
jgi:hypothetical protein